MLSEMRFLTLRLQKAVFLLSLLAIGCGYADTTCTSRRCLAQMLINYNLTSQPQSENCTQTIHVPQIEYQTVSIDTKSLHLISRLQATFIWMDPELSWNTSIYKYDKVVLPADTVWTPELQVTNALDTTTEPASSDLLVYSNGTVVHTVIVHADVNCEVNLFNYPFAADACPIAVQSWSTDGCGTTLTFGQMMMTDGFHGDWQTESAKLMDMGQDRSYILVSLRMKYINPFITLLLPSILIILADVVSFTLPISGGERNGFKVTLVLSFTMFLVILNDQLPGDSQCSPIIRTHFCVCLILLVLSMLVSMVLTRVAKDGRLFFNFRTKVSVSRRTKNKEQENDEGDISVVQLKGSDEDSRILRKVLNFLEDLSAKELENKRYERSANFFDSIFFWFYFIFGTVYFCSMMWVMVNYTCMVDHFGFWNT